MSIIYLFTNDETIKYNNKEFNNNIRKPDFWGGWIKTTIYLREVLKTFNKDNTVGLHYDNKKMKGGNLTSELWMTFRWPLLQWLTEGRYSKAHFVGSVIRP